MQAEMQRHQHKGPERARDMHAASQSDPAADRQEGKHFPGQGARAHHGREHGSQPSMRRFAADLPAHQDKQQDRLDRLRKAASAISKDAAFFCVL